ncbi:MAG: dephospho-CoA kinase [Roseburia sp.]|nr:dephospho-CoA kinase [Roseburia sp.]MCM1099119.1 dephospho-CoA kinase [Ruminococcus flavefaciens]
MKQNKPLFIGITGGIGAGKTEILDYIGKHYKCEIYLADQVAHRVKEPGTDCYRRLLEILGTDILSADGQIDRQRMAEKIFFSPGLLEAANGILHPAVRVYLLERLQEARDAGEAELFFVEAALLIECGYSSLVDEMWYVYAAEEVRRERLRRSRGYSEEKIEGILSKQLSETQFRENCDFIIDNSGSLYDSYRQIDRKLEAFTWQK